MKKLLLLFTIFVAISCGKNDPELETGGLQNNGTNTETSSNPDGKELTIYAEWENKDIYSDGAFKTFTLILEENGNGCFTIKEYKSDQSLKETELNQKWTNITVSDTQITYTADGYEPYTSAYTLSEDKKSLTLTVVLGNIATPSGVSLDTKEMTFGRK